ncbi:MAG: GNAT family N-acetyltransferase [Alistipes sp.]|nr:GNAT family N-acetyltransferase [Alistipes sp.]
MNIRPIQRNEIPLLADFLYEAIYRSNGTPLPRTVIQHPALWRYIDRFGTRRHDHCLVAEDGGTVVGAVWVRRMRGYGHIDDYTPEMAVALYPQWRGQGVGTRLIDAMEQLLRRKGYAAVSLSVQRANPAVRLYERAGFTVAQANGEELVMVKKFLPL